MRGGTQAVAAVVAVLSLASVAGGEGMRQRANMLVRGEATPADVTAERAFGREVAARILGRIPLDPDPGLNRYVGLVGGALALFSSRPELAYHFAVLDSDVANAWSAPGGYVFVTRGALARMEDEAELAGVLAHEIAHVTERHLVKELGIQASETGLAAGLAHLVGGAGESAGVAFRQSVDSALHILFERGYRLRDEFDADRVAVALVANAGYGAEPLARYLERLAPTGQAGDEHPTHPNSPERAARIRAEASRLGAPAPDTLALKERFASHVQKP